MYILTYILKHIIFYHSHASMVCSQFNEAQLNKIPNGTARSGLFVSEG
jgi:hypothetical protein